MRTLQGLSLFPVRVKISCFKNVKKDTFSHKFTPILKKNMIAKVLRLKAILLSGVFEPMQPEWNLLFCIFIQMLSSIHLVIVIFSL